jgi:DUF4097 and DUF4098 domain-containing protein YvlB
MSRAGKIWLIAAAVLILAGIGIFAAATSMNHGQMVWRTASNMVTNTYTIRENFSSISIRSDTEDIVFVPAKDGKCTVEFYENENEKHTAEVKNGTLEITAEEKNGKWTDHVSLFNGGDSKMTIALPESSYEALQIEEDTGDIRIPSDFSFESIEIRVSTGDVSCDASASGRMQITTSTGAIEMNGVSVGDLDLSVSTGNVKAESVQCRGDVSVRVSTGRTEMRNVTCQSFSSTGSTGRVEMKRMVAKETIRIERSTGDVIFEDCDAAEIFVKTTTGDVKGTLRSDKVFLVETHTGKTRIPKTITGGRCEVSTDTGDIEFTVG